MVKTELLMSPWGTTWVRLEIPLRNRADSWSLQMLMSLHWQWSTSSPAVSLKTPCCPRCLGRLAGHTCILTCIHTYINTNTKTNTNTITNTNTNTNTNVDIFIHTYTCLHTHINKNDPAIQTLSQSHHSPLTHHSLATHCSLTTHSPLTVHSPLTHHSLFTHHSLTTHSPLTVHSLYRDKNDPVITQDDLVVGCKLQMRGSLSHHSTVDHKVVPTFGLDELELAPSVQDTVG